MRQVAAISLIVACTLCASGSLSAWERCVTLELISVYDGDTIRAMIDGKNTPVRLATYDTPEYGHRARCLYESELAQAAQIRLVELIEAAESAELCLEGRRTWGREVAILLLDGRDVGDTLVAEGLARPWTGRREPWCP